MTGQKNSMRANGEKGHREKVRKRESVTKKYKVEESKGEKRNDSAKA